jgi:hypothetical protein
MAEISFGPISVTIPDSITIPEQAGNLSPLEVRRMPRARRGLGTACEDTASIMRNLGDSFSVPGVTADSLESAGQMAEEIDRVIDAVEVVLARLKQANLLIDADAWEQLRKVNDVVNALNKTNPALGLEFTVLRRYMKNR